MSDLTAIIVKEMTSRGFQVFGAETNRPNLQAFCFRGHDENTASLSIHRGDGRFFCFGCGVKGKSWNTLAKLIGAAALSEDDMPDQYEVLARDIQQQIDKDNITMALPWDLSPWKGEYRGLSEGFLRKCEASRWYDEGANCRRLLLPCKMQSELKGWVARRTDDKKEMKYRNAPKMPAQEILYPYDVVYRYLQKELQYKTAVLVEGPIDALRMVYNRIPTFAILGTNNYDPSNKLLLLNLGVERVVLAMDGDDAGKKARHAIAPDLEEWFEVEHFCPPWGTDPGDMEDKYVQKLKRQVLR